MRIGHGYDAHRFCENKPLVIGGVTIESDLGLLAHSDGDVLVHALADAILGAAGERDIGYNFPDNDNTYKNIDSCILLSRTAELIRGKGFSIDYADMTIVAQKPKLSPYIIPMREKLASVLGISVDRINVKATTEEKMGFTGRGEGISAHAVVILKE
ncbi:MAG: 2-C-methyl-D-erythritol 2,4-cyclodiphosphate synthase [Ruminococcaceae bacterium]|nr:2-C-methyl-D-erythritol 2,4-cyclodiphosphate synthase [Oscillospiraceae bacterium]